MSKKNLVLVFVVAFLGSMLALNSNKLFFVSENDSYKSIQERQGELGVNSVNVNYESTVPKALDFTIISDLATNSVVHIRSTHNASVKSNGY